MIRLNSKTRNKKAYFNILQRRSDYKSQQHQYQVAAYDNLHPARYRAGSSNRCIEL